MQKYNNGTDNKKLRDTIMQIASLNLLRVGYLYYLNGGLASSTSFVYYWIATQGGSPTSAYSLLFGPDYLYPQYHIDRGSGISIRCLAR